MVQNRKSVLFIQQIAHFQNLIRWWDMQKTEQNSHFKRVIVNDTEAKT